MLQLPTSTGGRTRWLRYWLWDVSLNICQIIALRSSQNLSEDPRSDIESKRRWGKPSRRVCIDGGAVMQTALVQCSESDTCSARLRYCRSAQKDCIPPRGKIENCGALKTSECASIRWVRDTKNYASTCAVPQVSERTTKQQVKQATNSNKQWHQGMCQVAIIAGALLRSLDLQRSE